MEIARIADTTTALTPLEQSILIALLRYGTETEFWHDEENAPVAIEAVEGLIKKVMEGSTVATMEREIGEIAMFAHGELPAKWLWCDGQLHSPTDYPLLYAKIGVSFGGNTAIPNFRTPNFQSRSPMGYGQGDGLSSRSMATFYGEENVTLTIEQIPSHSHGQRGNSGGSGALRTAGILGAGDTNHTTTTQSAGDGQSHRNVHPVLVVRFAIYAGE